MDKLFHSTFDFFSHALPGFCILCSFFILDESLTDARQFLQFSGQMNIGSGVMLLLMAYITGFAINPIGRWLYRFLGFRLWNHKIENDLPLFISDKFVLIRELSPANFRYVETWHMFSSMAHNLAIASLNVLVLSLIKLAFRHPQNAGFWWVVVLLSIAFFFLFLHRAVRFYKWAADDLNAALKTLHLEERARNAARPTEA